MYPWLISKTAYQGAKVQFLTRYPFCLLDYAELQNLLAIKFPEPHSLDMDGLSKYIKQNSLLLFDTKKSVKQFKVAVLFSR